MNGYSILDEVIGVGVVMIVIMCMAPLATRVIAAWQDGVTDDEMGSDQHNWRSGIPHAVYTFSRNRGPSRDLRNIKRIKRVRARRKDDE